MSSRHYMMYRRYNVIEPIGFPHDERRHGALMAAVHRASGNKFNNNAVHKAESWMHRIIKPMTAEQIAGAFSQIPKTGNTKRRGRQVYV